MSWLIKKKGYKALVEEKKSNEQEQEQEQKQEQTFYFENKKENSSSGDSLHLAASSYLTNSDYSEKKEESSLYQAQPNKEKLKKIL